MQKGIIDCAMYNNSAPMPDNNQNILKYNGGRMSLEDTVRHAEYVRKKYGKKRNEKIKKILDDRDGAGNAPAPLNKGDGGNDSPSAGAEAIVVKRKRQRVNKFI
jgi:hypothetical protein